MYSNKQEKAESTMAEAKSLKDLMRIRLHNRELLASINGNLGTVLGFKKKPVKISLIKRLSLC